MVYKAQGNVTTWLGLSPHDKVASPAPDHQKDKDQAETMSTDLQTLSHASPHATNHYKGTNGFWNVRDSSQEKDLSFKCQFKQPDFMTL